MVDFERDPRVKKFYREYGRSIHERAPVEIVNDGDPSCLHEKICYLSDGFEGQAFWCDLCDRHERIDYSPGYKIPLPPNSLVRTPNPQYGNGQFYAFKVDEDGEVHPLSQESWVPKED